MDTASLMQAMKEMMDNALTNSLSQVATDISAIQTQVATLAPTVTWLQEQVHDMLVEEGSRPARGAEGARKERKTGEATAMHT